MPGSQTYDKYGHPNTTQTGATQLTAGAVSTSAAGTISPTTAAGAAPTVSLTGGDATDARGNFLLQPVTGGGAQAAGEVALVRFAAAYGSKPAAVLVTMENETDGNVVPDATAADVTADGFDVAVGAALTTAKDYRVQYVVFP